MENASKIEKLKIQRKRLTDSFAAMLLRSDGNISGMDASNFALSIERINAQIEILETE